MTTEPVSIQPPQEADDRPEVYVEDGRIIIRASAMGGCIRNLVAARMGIRAVPFDEKAKQRMNEGVIHEPHILKHLETLGWKTMDTQAVLELPIAGGKIIIRGHSDGTVRHDNVRLGERVAEVKAQGRDVWDKWKRFQWEEFRRYAYQLSIYMAITGLPGLFATKNRDTGEVDITLWDQPPISLAQLKARAIKVASAVELPACDPVMWGCSRYFIHTDDHEIDPFTGLEVKRGTAAAVATGRIPEAELAVFEELARAYQEAKDDIARGEAKRKEVGERLLAFLKAHELKKGETTSWAVSEVNRNDTRLDTKALQADHPDLAKKYMVKSSSRYVNVKRLNEAELEEVAK